MSKHKYTTIFGIVIVMVMLIATVAFLAGPYWGLKIIHNEPAYAAKLFDTSKVHNIDIVVKEADWQAMLADAQAEEYIQCSVVIDGDYVKGVGIRPKGNSSLSMVARSDSDRYSFKIEFDQYEKGKNYLGLDKLVLNNIAQDNTYMKDYTTYQMMNAMGADAPLSSFIWITVNGEDWGLYLAAEGVEDAFAQRVYGKDFGQIYKPDSMNMGNRQGNNANEPLQGGFPMPDGQMPNFEDGEGRRFRNMPEGGGTSLVYIDDNPDSYAAIFDNAKFNPSDGDKKRLIASLKKLSEGENIEQVVNIDEVIRYFVVHNFVLNSDSYTGNIVHNYYLAENDGRLSMIAWDYNLAFGGMGGFGMGRDMGRMPAGADNADTVDIKEIETSRNIDNATSMVNYPIDSPMLSGSIDERPMIAWIFNNEEYLAKYHEIFEEYMAYFDSGEFTLMYDNALALISPYVKKDTMAFCTYEDFQKGSSALRQFCLLRAESIKGQLNGSISSTQEGQRESSNNGFIDASSIDMQSMGSNSMGFDRARNGEMQNNFDLPAAQRRQPDNGSIIPPENQQGRPGRDNGEFFDNPNVRPDSGNFVKENTQDALKSSWLTNEFVLLIASIILLVGGVIFAKTRRG